MDLQDFTLNDRDIIPLKERKFGVVDLTAEEFVSKVKEFLESGEQMFMRLDIDYDQLATGSYNEGVVYKSPVLCSMAGPEYDDFNSQLRELVPEPDRQRGLYW